MRQNADSKGKKFVIPKGDICATSTAVQHRVDAFFEDADKYDYKRFLEPRSEDKKAKFTFIGFGGGRHGCMGTNFAYLQIKTVRVPPPRALTIRTLRLLHVSGMHSLRPLCRSGVCSFGTLSLSRSTRSRLRTIAAWSWGPSPAMSSTRGALRHCDDRSAGRAPSWRGACSARMRPPTVHDLLDRTACLCVSRVVSLRGAGPK